MEWIFSLWTFAPEFKAKLAVFLVLAQVFITIWCYTQLAKARIAAVKAGEIVPEDYKAVGDNEPEHVRVFTRLLANQFEAPVLFFAMIITGMALGITSWVTILLGALFIVFRIQHAREMTGEHVVLRRRKVFIRSMQCMSLMAFELAFSALFFLEV